MSRQTDEDDFIARWKGLTNELAAMTATCNELKTALRKIAALDFQNAATNGCAYEANALAHQALANALTVAGESNSELTARVQLAERRLAEEIKWGHRCCTADNCASSGTDCPARAEAAKERG